jgi:hypothetical protein
VSCGQGLFLNIDVSLWECDIEYISFFKKSFFSAITVCEKADWIYSKF